MSQFEKSVRESERIVEKSESWDATIGEYRIFVHRDNKGLTEVSVTPVNWDSLRLGIIRFHPKSVEDIEKFAAHAGELLLAIAGELRAAGLTDLRSKNDRWRDEWDAEREKEMEKMRAKWAAVESSGPERESNGTQT